MPPAPSVTQAMANGNEWPTPTAGQPGVDGFGPPKGSSRCQASRQWRCAACRSPRWPFIIYGPLKVAQDGTRNGVAFSIADVSLSCNARALMRAGLLASCRSKPGDFHR